MTPEEFVALVRRMREAQKRYGKSGIRSHYLEAERLQNEVDRFLAEGGKIVRQATLFPDAPGPYERA